MARRPKIVYGKYVGLERAHPFWTSERRDAVQLLRDQIARAIRKEEPQVKKYARVRWGIPSGSSVSSAEAARRLNLSLAEAISLEAQILDRIPFALPEAIETLGRDDDANVLATFDVSPRILLASEVVSEQLVRALVEHPELLRGVHHRQFEELVAFFFDKLGYEVELTKRTRDGGRDVIAVRHGEVAVRYLVECKHPVSGNPVGIGPVRQLYAVKIDEGATKALLATTSVFTRDAYLFAERHRWELELKDYDAVMGWLRKLTDR